MQVCNFLLFIFLFFMGLHIAEAVLGFLGCPSLEPSLFCIYACVAQAVPPHSPHSLCYGEGLFCCNPCLVDSLGYVEEDAGGLGQVGIEVGYLGSQ